MRDVSLVDAVDAGRVPSGRRGGPVSGTRPDGPATRVVGAVAGVDGAGPASPRAGRPARPSPGAARRIAGAGQGLAVVPER